MVYIKYNRALRRRYNARDTLDPIILEDTGVQNANEWFMEALDEENIPVFEGDDLFWGHVADAMGVNEPPYATRKTSGKNGAAAASTSNSKSKGKGLCLVDEESEEERDASAYKDHVSGSDGDEEPEYEELDDF